MRSPQAPWRGRPDLEPFPAPGVAALRPEVTAAVAFGREHHFAIAPRANKGVEPLHRYRAVQRAAENSEVVGQRRDVSALSVAGCYRLRIEVVRIDEIDVLGTEMKSEVDDLALRSDIVQLREGIHSLLLRFVAREWKRAAGGLSR